MALWRLHVDVADQPGRLGALAAAIGGCGANIVSLHVVGEPTQDGAVTDELLVKVPPQLAVPALVEAVEAAGFRTTVVVQADAQALADPVSTALALAHCVAVDPGSAARAVAALLRAELAGAGAPASAHQVEVGAGATRVRLRRGWPFTATEISRATALLELAGTSTGRRPPPPRAIVQLADGSEVVLRETTAADAPLVAALHARCSPQTRSMRSLPTTPVLAGAVLQQLVGADGATGVLAVTTDGSAAVGLANLISAGPATAEVALMVEDAWQDRGVGTALTRKLVELARTEKLTELTAVSQVGNHALTRVLRRAGLRPRGRLEAGALHVRVSLRPETVYPATMYPATVHPETLEAETLHPESAHAESSTAQGPHKKTPTAQAQARLA